MDKREYFRQLASLYEATINSPTDEEVVPQEQIADTEADAGMQNPQQPEEEAQEEQDPNMQDEFGAMQQLGDMPDSPADVFEKEKLKKIFDYLSDLDNYADSFLDSLKNMDTNLLDLKDLGRLLKLKE